MKRLHLPTLKYKRIRGDMTEVYKIFSGKYDTTVTNPSRQTATEIYTKLRAAFRDGSDYDPAENCSAVK